MDFVVLTLEAFNAMEETAHLLSTPANTERLMESIAQDRAGNVVVKQLDLRNEKPSRRNVKAPVIRKRGSTKRPGK
jgi:antitoxin YefM